MDSQDLKTIYSELRKIETRERISERKVTASDPIQFQTVIKVSQPVKIAPQITPEKPKKPRKQVEPTDRPCKESGAKKGRKKPTIRTCQVCDRLLGQGQGKLCSIQCKRIAEGVTEKKCETCDGTLDNRQKKHCSRECQSIAARSKRLMCAYCRLNPVASTRNTYCSKYCASKGVIEATEPQRRECEFCDRVFFTHVTRTTCGNNCLAALNIYKRFAEVGI